MLGHFRVALSLCFKARLNECEAIAMKTTFYSRANKTHFHLKDFPLSFVLKERVWNSKMSYCLLQSVTLNPNASLHAATGTKTFPGKTVTQSFSQCQSFKPQYISTHIHSPDQSAQDLVERCCHKRRQSTFP